MAGRRVRRRRTGVWLPNLGTVQPEGTGRENADHGRTIQLTVRGDAGITQLIIPITFDNPVEVDETQVTDETGLEEFLGNEYFLERIVGNCFVQFKQRNNNVGGDISPGGAVATAAFFVARADGTLIDSNQPIGATVSTQAELSSYSPQNDVNIREPWIWRRSWLIGNLFQPALGTDDGQFTVTLRLATRTFRVAEGCPVHSSTPTLSGSSVRMTGSGSWLRYEATQSTRRVMDNRT